MRRECRERFPRHRPQRKQLVSDPGMHHCTCVTHVPWCMPGSLTAEAGKTFSAIPGACATRNFTYLVRGPKNEPVLCVYTWNTCLGRVHCQMQIYSSDQTVLCCALVLIDCTNIIHGTLTPGLSLDCPGASEATLKIWIKRSYEMGSHTVSRA